jgi:hypothetical protein
MLGILVAVKVSVREGVLLGILVAVEVNVFEGKLLGTLVAVEVNVFVGVLLGVTVEDTLAIGRLVCISGIQVESAEVFVIIVGLGNWPGVEVDVHVGHRVSVGIGFRLGV